ncbi:MAG: hypothetical protein ABIQ95_07885 [Bdellovibrionia bacterium]
MMLKPLGNSLCLYVQISESVLHLAQPRIAYSVSTLTPKSGVCLERGGPQVSRLKVLKEK